MPYGIIKVDQVTFTNAGVDQTISVSGIVASISGNITATGTISGNVIRGGTTVSGATVTGTAGQFGTITGNTAGFTTVTGTTVTGATATFTSGVFTNISGGTHTITSGVFASGTAANPSITFQGDVNTGIYSPAADQVAISTSGSGRLFVDASGRVGINSAPSLWLLEVKQDSASSAGGAYPVIQVNNPNANGYAGVYLNDSTAQAGLETQRNTGHLGLQAGGSERLRITSAGLVGVGTSSPAQTLDVNGTVNFKPAAGYNVLFQQSSTSLRLNYLNDAGSANVSAAYRATSYEWQKGDGAPVVNIDSSGRLGIGTSAPSSALDVEGIVTAKSGAFDAGGFLNKYGGDANSRSWWIKSDTHSYGDFAIRQSTTQTGSSYDTKLLIDASGRVGIGTTSPSERLHVAGTTLAYGNGAAPFRWGNTSSVGTLTYSGDDALIQTSSGSASLVFLRSSAETARIDSSGRLLVGTSSARANFYNSTVNSQVLLESNSTSSGERILANVHNSASANGPIFLLAKSRSASIGGNTVVVDGDALGAIDFQGNDGSEFVLGARIQAEVDGTPGANDMPGRLVFSTTADGASSPTERMRITNGGRIEVWGGSNVNSINLVTPVTAGTTYYLIYGGYSSSSPGNYGTQSFGVWSNGNVVNTNNSYAGISDSKLKENVVDATSQWSDIKALQVRKYNFKEGQTHTQIGLIAQEVELVSPGLVSESPDRDQEGNDLGTVTKSVNYSVLYMKAVKALQEAMERIETLEAKVAALEGA